MADNSGKGRSMIDGGETKKSADPARALALDLLRGVWVGRRTLAELEAGGEAQAAAPADRARAGRLARATLRHTARADAVLKPFLMRAPRADIRDVLRLAVVEMLGEGGAPHGVVKDAVTLARARQVKAAGMVNAVLRRVSESGAETWAKAPPQRLPNWLRGRLGSAWGNARAATLEAAHEVGAPLDLTLRNVAEADSQAERLDAQATPTGSLRRSARTQVSALAGFETGEWWVQDAAAALPARLLVAQPGERVLDLCAAPGGKTLQLAAVGAEVTALDSSEGRLGRLYENLKRTGLSADVVCADALEWAPEVSFDAVLLDAPCSATGTIRRHPDLPFVRDASDLKALVSVQARLLDRALSFLRPGGRLVYCTCSLLPDEGEAQITSALERHSDLAAMTDAFPFLPDDWRSGQGWRTMPDLWPEIGGLDGFFMARLTRAE